MGTGCWRRHSRDWGQSQDQPAQTPGLCHGIQYFTKDCSIANKILIHVAVQYLLLQKIYLISTWLSKHPKHDQWKWWDRLPNNTIDTVKIFESFKNMWYMKKYLVSWMEADVRCSDELQDFWSEITIGHVYKYLNGMGMVGMTGAVSCGIMFKMYEM